MHRPSLAVSVSALLLLPVCGPDTAEPSEFAELCGTLGPHRLLALEPGERLDPFFGATRVDDRLYFIAGVGEEQFLGQIRPVTRTVSSTGLCGEDRRVIADDIRLVFKREKLPGLLLGCRGELEGDLVVLDPAGVTAPRLLISDGCSGATWTDQGIARVDEDADNGVRILFYPYPVDPDAAPIEPVVLAERIQDRSNVSFTHGPAGEELLAVNLDGDLLRLSLPGGETTVLQTAVHNFDASSDGHYLVLEDLLTASDDPGDSPGDLTLRDRWTGVDTVLATAPHPFLIVRFRESTIQLSGGLDDGGRVIALPSLAEAEIPAGRNLVFQLSNERWLLTGDDGWYLRNPVAGTETLLTAEHGGLVGANLDHMDMLHDGPGGEPGGHALPLTPFFDWDTLLNGPERDMIAYQVLDDERSGVWIARPAAE